MENDNDNGIVFNDVGELCKQFLFDLSKSEIEVYTVSYTGSENIGKDCHSFKRNTTTIIKYDCLNHCRFTYLKDYISFIVVPLTWAQLEKEIDFLLSLKIPLIIYSTNYDEELINAKALNAGVSLVILDLNVIILKNVIEVVRNVNGGTDYSNSVFKAINFLKIHKGQFTGLDLV